MKGYSSDGVTWQFHKRWDPIEPSWFNLGKQMIYKIHPGGWELNGKTPDYEQNNKNSVFVEYSGNCKIVNDEYVKFFVPDPGMSEEEARRYKLRTFLLYFGNPVIDGDYPCGKLTDEQILNMDVVPVLKLVSFNDKDESNWRPIRLRPEDAELADNRRRLRPSPCAPAPAPAPAPVRHAVEIPAGYGPSSAIAGFGRRRGGARKTKARRSVKKRRTARRTRQ